VKHLLSITLVGVLASGTLPANMFAQSTLESRVAVTVGSSVSSYGPVSGMRTAFGLSMRLWTTRQLTGRLSGSYAIPFSTGSRVCVENPCDTRRFRDEWRVGADVRRLLGATAVFTHVAFGVSASRITGEASQLWEDWGQGERRSPLGFGQIGIGIRSRRAQRTRWVEAGLERQAASSLTGVYVRAGLGIL
jgi:hypothetical protein